MRRTFQELSYLLRIVRTKTLSVNTIPSQHIWMSILSHLCIWELNTFQLGVQICTKIKSRKLQSDRDSAIVREEMASARAVYCPQAWCTTIQYILRLCLQEYCFGNSISLVSFAYLSVVKHTSANSCCKCANIIWMENGGTNSKTNGGSSNNKDKRARGENGFSK